MSSIMLAHPLTLTMIWSNPEKYRRCHWWTTQVTWWRVKSDWEPGNYGAHLLQTSNRNNNFRAMYLKGHVHYGCPSNLIKIHCTGGCHCWGHITQWNSRRSDVPAQAFASWIMEYRWVRSIRSEQSKVLFPYLQLHEL